jgi:hypothetical protein
VACNFGDEFDVVVGFFQEGTNFVSQRRFSDAVGSNERELQGRGVSIASKFLTQIRRRGNSEFGE